MTHTVNDLLARLQGVLLRIHACSIPDVMNGYDRCPCGSGETWPCAVTQAVWIAEGKDRYAEASRLIQLYTAEHAEQEWF